MQRVYLITSLSQLCEDCGQVGNTGFRKVYGHSCLSQSCKPGESSCFSHGYKPGEVSAALRMCPTCRLYFRSVTDVIWHNAMTHCRFQYSKCPIINCGRVYFNDAAHDIHVPKYHGSWALFTKEIHDQYGPFPGDR